MKTRAQRILECVSVEAEGLTTRQITESLGDEAGKGFARNSTTLTILISRGFVKRAAKGEVCVITPAGRAELAQRQAVKVRRHHGSQASSELSDRPIVLRTTAVDGQAPTGLVNSPFTWAQAAPAGNCS